MLNEKIVFIPLVKAPENCIELKFALRSMESAFGIDKLVICGDHVPDWLTNFEIIHYPDIKDPRRKEENIYHKIKHALRRYPEIIFANDDHFVSDMFDPVFNFKQGTLQAKINSISGSSYYRKTILNTIDLVGISSAPYFDVHCPIIYKADRFPDIDFSAVGNWGVCLKSVYANHNQLPGVEVEDCKLRARHSNYSALTTKLFFSSVEPALCTKFFEYLQSRWPNKSKFEK